MRLVLVMNILISDTISTGVRRSLSLNYIICNISSSTSSTLSSMRLSQIKLLFLGKVYLVWSSFFHSAFMFSIVTQIIIFEPLFIRCFLLIIHVLFILCLALIYHILNI